LAALLDEVDGAGEHQGDHGDLGERYGKTLAALPVAAFLRCHLGVHPRKRVTGHSHALEGVSTLLKGAPWRSTPSCHRKISPPSPAPSGSETIRPPHSCRKARSTPTRGCPPRAAAGSCATPPCAR